MIQKKDEIGVVDTFFIDSLKWKTREEAIRIILKRKLTFRVIRSGSTFSRRNSPVYLTRRDYNPSRITITVNNKDRVIWVASG